MKHVSFLLLLIAACANSYAAETGASAEKTEKPVDVIKRVYAAMTSDDEKGFERLGLAKPGTWRAESDELPETIEHYRNSARVYPTPERFSIVLQPLEPLDEGRRAQLEMMREFVAAFFQLPVRVAEPIDVDASARKLKLTRIIHVDRFKTRTQLNAGKILDDLLFEKTPADAVIYVGITTSDLFFDGIGVLGLASLRGRVAVCSTYKFAASSKDCEQSKLAETRNLCRLLSHEIGHTFGLGHCVFYRCAMNGCNSLNENTSAPLHYCPVCREKLALNNGIEQARRLETLEKFYSKHGLKDEAAWTRQQLINLKD